MFTGLREGKCRLAIGAQRGRRHDSQRTSGILGQGRGAGRRDQGLRIPPESAQPPSPRPSVRGRRERRRAGASNAIQVRSLNGMAGRSQRPSARGGGRLSARSLNKNELIGIRPTPAPTGNLKRFPSAGPLPQGERLNLRSCFEAMSTRLAQFVKWAKIFPPDFPGGSGCLRIPRLARAWLVRSAVTIEDDASEAVRRRTRSDKAEPRQPVAGSVGRRAETETPPNGIGWPRREKLQGFRRSGLHGAGFACRGASS